MPGSATTTADIALRIIENLQSAVLLFDHALHLSYINPAAEMMFAVSAKQMAGGSMDDLLSGNDFFAATLARVLSERRPLTEREVQLTLPGLRNTTVDYSVTPLYGAHKNLELLVEFQQLDRQLRITKEENLRVQQQATRAIVRGMAHEIKNPLGGLRGAAQLLEAELGDDSFKEYTGIIIGEADRLRNLLNRMLGPNTLPQKRNANIHEVLERVRSVVKAEVPTGILFERDYDPSIPELNADSDQLIQALLNIVRNATQALKGQGTIKLRTRAQRQFTIGNRHHKLVIRVEVIDDGPGVPADMIENIFYPMVTGRAEGTGLGLSIAQSLITQHNGLIECTSRPGKTKFTLLLPLETDDDYDKTAHLGH
ncbi:MAG: nitrogen regulation protein NR(II) [Gammaproteobacteria bacterium]|nr:nitrogen regulation protein NR(II) [Gammaproteobacteria bacterium]